MNKNIAILALFAVALSAYARPIVPPDTPQHTNRNEALAAYNAEPNEFTALAKLNTRTLWVENSFVRAGNTNLPALLRAKHCHICIYDVTTYPTPVLEAADVYALALSIADDGGLYPNRRGTAYPYQHAEVKRLFQFLEHAEFATQAQIDDWNDLRHVRVLSNPAEWADVAAFIQGMPGISGMDPEILLARADVLATMGEGLDGDPVEVFAALVQLDAVNPAALTRAYKTLGTIKAKRRTADSIARRKARRKVRTQ